MEPIFIVGFIAIAVVMMVLGYIASLRRREAMAAMAAKLGLRFAHYKDHAIARRYNFLDKLRAGQDRYAYNVLSGDHQGHSVTIFDYHYRTGSGKNTQHHYISCFTLQLPAAFPELVIGPEGFFSKIAQAVGYDDIDFESHEFSRTFCVRSANKKFAYDVCNARMIEYLLSNPDLTIEIEGSTMAITFGSRLSPELIEPNLKRLITLRSLMPDYLFTLPPHRVEGVPPSNRGQDARDTKAEWR